MSALSSYLDGKVGFEQWFIKARESHSCLGGLKIRYCNRSMKRSPFQSEYTSEIIKEREKNFIFRTQLIKPGSDMFDFSNYNLSDS